jgi:hypothetical protein
MVYHSFIHGDATVVPPLGTTGMAIEQQAASSAATPASLVLG